MVEVDCGYTAVIAGISGLAAAGVEFSSYRPPWKQSFSYAEIKGYVSLWLQIPPRDVLSSWQIFGEVYSGT